MSICLYAIVRDEHNWLRPFLDVCEPFCDHYVICDTGSKDDTREIAAGWLSDHPGTLIERRWEGFADALNFTLAEARKSGCSHLFQSGVREPPQLTGPLPDELPRCGLATLRQGETEWYVPLFHSADEPCQFVGRTHSYLSIDKSEAVRLPLVIDDLDPICSRKKLRRDLRLLTLDHLDDPTEPRWVFYLAQAERVLGNHVRAINYYRLREQMGGWDEEVWYAGYMRSILQRSTHEMLLVWERRPWRAEPLRHLARDYHANGSDRLAAEFDRIADGIPLPDGDVLFIERGAYTFRS